MSLTKEQREFDYWFFKQSFVKQAECRSLGILPYREQPQERFSFPIFANAKCFAYDPWNAEVRSEEDTFISREKLSEIVSKILLTLERSPDRKVRLHVEMLRIVLRTPDAMTNGELCSQYQGITRQGIHYRVREMRRILYGGGPRKSKATKPACQTGIAGIPLQNQKATEANSDAPAPVRESPKTPGSSCVATHYGKKTRLSKRKRTSKL